MKKQHHHAKDILRRYVNGQCTEEERAWVEEWYKTHYHSAFNMDSTLAEEHLNQIWLEFDNEMKPKRVSPIRKIAAIAASIAIVIGSGIVYFNRPDTPGSTSFTAREGAKKIQAGRDQALLTLADGRTIHLDSIAVGDYVSESNITIIKMDDGTLSYEIKDAPESLAKEMYNTISTPRGGQYKVVLPDNSVVWLNAASSLRFPVAFTADTRSVELIGEGYFEIAHEEQHPFIVRSGDQQTIVKGTKFNITSYPDAPEKTTTLLSGSVLVKNRQDEVLLRPNEQAVLHNDVIVKSAVDATEAIAWKNGKFIFNDTPLQTIMQQLSRWYDVEVTYLESVEGITFTGSVSRFDDIQDVLRKISLTESIQLETEGRRVMVRR